MLFTKSAARRGRIQLRLAAVAKLVQAALLTRSGLGRLRLSPASRRMGAKTAEHREAITQRSAAPSVVDQENMEGLGGARQWSMIKLSSHAMSSAATCATRSRRRSRAAPS